MNTVHFGGYIASDIKVFETKKTLPDGTPVIIAQFLLGVQCQRKTRPSFATIKIFGKRAEVAKNFFHKGMQLFIKAEYRVDYYVSKTGEKRTSHYFVLEDFDFGRSGKKYEKTATQVAEEMKRNPKTSSDEIQGINFPVVEEKDDTKQKMESVNYSELPKTKEFEFE